ncbi:hypothetical protein CWI75_15350 [Kineobactrum sediminis]|uniref:Polyketide cyclase n=1 Tax=Kineobactrum sediminis TaxID=1905677 RepID=A0A2N5XZ39_9GAMM|nr:ester cyclase [Kineobactrum sediminis]PLW81406.1 hypothetical protein CWI75_15350 [Kineobactrum sediminis]
MTDFDAAKRARPLKRSDMPPDYAISLDRYINRDGTGGGFREDEKCIPTDFGVLQPMGGFEEAYHNIIDYIVRITYRIWEDRDVEYIGDTYSADCMVFDDYGLQCGCEKIISDTHHTLGAFTNIKLIADEIIWAGDDENGYHTSHRTIIRGTNDGDSKYGPATGKTVDVLVIANCVVRDNKIFLEHVLYNNSALVEQLGVDLHEVVQNMVAVPPAGWPRDDATWHQLRNATNPGMPISVSESLDGFDIDRFSRDACEMVWSAQNYKEMTRFFSSEISFAGATNRTAEGLDGYRNAHRSIMDCFTVDNFSVDEVYWMGNGQDGYLVSVRWSMDAEHAGSGAFGPATGNPVQLWGLSQYKVIEEKIVQEWTLFNELDLQIQIAAARSKEA